MNLVISPLLFCYFPFNLHQRPSFPRLPLSHYHTTSDTLPHFLDPQHYMYSPLPLSPPPSRHRTFTNSPFRYFAIKRRLPSMPCVSRGRRAPLPRVPHNTLPLPLPLSLLLAIIPFLIRPFGTWRSSATLRRLPSMPCVSRGRRAPLPRVPQVPQGRSTQGTRAHGNG